MLSGNICNQQLAYQSKIKFAFAYNGNKQLSHRKVLQSKHWSTIIIGKKIMTVVAKNQNLIYTALSVRVI